MDLVKIDGVVYDALVSAIEEIPTVVEGNNSGTAIHRQRDIRDIKGIKYTHKVTFSPSDEHPELFDSLYSYLFDNIRESVQLEIVHNQEHISYEARYNTGARRVAYINDKEDFVGWDDLTVEFRSIETVINPVGV